MVRMMRPTVQYFDGERAYLTFIITIDAPYFSCLVYTLNFRIDMGGIEKKLTWGSRLSTITDNQSGCLGTYSMRIQDTTILGTTTPNGKR